MSLTSTLTTLWITLGSSSSKTGKILDLMRYLVQGISITRQESYLEKLIHQLLKCINSKQQQDSGSSNSSVALGTLACLCHNNYLVGKLLLASMTSEERKDLYSGSFEDAKTTVNKMHTIANADHLKLIGTITFSGLFGLFDNKLKPKAFRLRWR